MNETKFHHVMMYITFFSLGVIMSGIMVSQGLYQEMIYVMLAGVIFLFISLAYNYVRGIDYMTTNHPDYKGEDLFDEGETESKL
jgi:hypothetical protein